MTQQPETPTSTTHFGPRVIRQNLFFPLATITLINKYHDFIATEASFLSQGKFIPVIHGARTNLDPLPILSDTKSIYSRVMSKVRNSPKSILSYLFALPAFREYFVPRMIAYLTKTLIKGGDLPDKDYLSGVNYLAFPLDVADSRGISLRKIEGEGVDFEPLLRAVGQTEIRLDQLNLASCVHLRFGVANGSDTLGDLLEAINKNLAKYVQAYYDFADVDHPLNFERLYNEFFLPTEEKLLDFLKQEGAYDNLIKLLMATTGFNTDLNHPDNAAIKDVLFFKNNLAEDYLSDENPALPRPNRIYNNLGPELKELLKSNSTLRNIVKRFEENPVPITNHTLKKLERAYSRLYSGNHRSGLAVFDLDKPVQWHLDNPDHSVVTFSDEEVSVLQSESVNSLRGYANDLPTHVILEQHNVNSDRGNKPFHKNGYERYDYVITNTDNKNYCVASGLPLLTRAFNTPSPGYGYKSSRLSDPLEKVFYYGCRKGSILHSYVLKFYPEFMAFLDITYPGINKPDLFAQLYLRSTKRLADIDKFRQFIDFTFGLSIPKYLQDRAQFEQLYDQEVGEKLKEKFYSHREENKDCDFDSLGEPWFDYVDTKEEFKVLQLLSLDRKMYNTCRDSSTATTFLKSLVSPRIKQKALVSYTIQCLSVETLKEYAPLLMSSKREAFLLDPANHFPIPLKVGDDLVARTYLKPLYKENDLHRMRAPHESASRLSELSDPLTFWAHNNGGCLNGFVSDNGELFIGRAHNLIQHGTYKITCTPHVYSSLFTDTWPSDSLVAVLQGNYAPEPNTQQGSIKIIFAEGREDNQPGAHWVKGIQYLPGVGVGELEDTVTSTYEALPKYGPHWTMLLEIKKDSNFNKVLTLPNGNKFRAIHLLKSSSSQKFEKVNLNSLPPGLEKNWFIPCPEMPDITFVAKGGPVHSTVSRSSPTDFITKGYKSTPISMGYNSRPEQLHGFISVDPVTHSFKFDNENSAGSGRYYGMEIELESKSGLRFSDFLRDQLILGESCGLVSGTDGSLNNGIEFRTCPQSFEALRINLKKFYDKVKPNFRTESTCGLHIHVSRKSITPLQLGRVMQFIYAKQNHYFIMKVARRGSGSYQEYVSTCPNVAIGSKLKRGYTSHTYIMNDKKRWFAKNGTKYTAVNTLHQHTIEFRLFAGADTYEKAMSSLEFVDAILKYMAVSDFGTGGKDQSRVKDFAMIACQSVERFTNWLCTSPDAKDYVYLRKHLELESKFSKNQKTLQEKIALKVAKHAAKKKHNAV